MGDFISRQVAYDVLTDYYHHTTEIQHKALQEALSRVPSAEPQIIYCKDCKHRGAKNCIANMLSIIFGADVNDVFYCGLAERRTDE